MESNSSSSSNSYLDRLEAFLRERYPECVLVPTRNNSPDSSSGEHATGKTPLVRHKGVDGETMWRHWRTYWRWNCDKGLLLVLRGGLIVLDVDEESVALALEDRFPQLKTTAAQRTRTGRHYFFERTAACEEVRLYDAARCLVDPDTTEALPIDVKTVCSTGTGGVISIVPSPNKAWLRAPYEHAPLPLPHELLLWIMARHKRSAISGGNNNNVGGRAADAADDDDAASSRGSSSSVSQLLSSTATSLRGDANDVSRSDDDAGAMMKSARMSMSNSGRSSSSRSSNLPMPFEMDANTAGDLVLKCLSPSRADGYDEWIAVGMALKHANDAFFDLWVRFSERSPKFEGRDQCASKWASFNCSGDGGSSSAVRTMGSIIRWAQQDNPAAFAEVMDGSLYGTILKSDAKSHTSIARVVARLYSDRYVCVETPKRWYVFDGHRWAADTGAWSVWRLLRDELPRVYASMATSQQRRLAEMDPDDADARKPIVQCVARLNEVVLRLGNERFKDAMVRESALFMCSRDFVDTLDAKDNLLGFKNGVYDLDAGVFRDGAPDDRVSMSCGYDFTTEDDPAIQADIDAVVASTQASAEATEYLWRLMAYLLHGRKYMELLWFFTGSGRNGKGTIAALLKAALGEYFYAPDAGIFTSADRNASAPKPEVMMMKSKRVVMASEPDDADGSSFKVSKLKAWRGNDLISARTLYRDVTTFRPQFGIIISMNDKPQLDKLDRAIASTLRIVDFPFEFVDAANGHDVVLQRHQRPMDCGLKKRFEDVRYSQQFMRMLLRVYAENREEVFLKSRPIPTPASVLAATQEYVEDNNEVGTWLAANYQRTDSARDRINFATLHAEFKRDAQSRIERTPFKKAMAHNGWEPRSLNGRVTYTNIRRREEEDEEADAGTDELENLCESDIR